MNVSQKPSRGPECLSYFHIDQLLTEGLDAQTNKASRAHIESCSFCTHRVREVEDQKRRFEASMPPLEALANTVSQSGVTAPESPSNQTPDVIPIQRARQRRRGLGPKSALSAGAALIAAAAAVLLWVRVEQPTDPQLTQPPSLSPPEAPAKPMQTRRKGALREANVYVARDGETVLLVPDDVVHPEETIQIVYSATQDGYLAVLSRDGAGVGSIYFPANGQETAPIAAGDDMQLPSATILDDTLGAETLYILFCPQSIEVESLRAALESDPEHATFPAQCAVKTLNIEKRIGPAD